VVAINVKEPVDDKYVGQAKLRGLSVIFITHNLYHVYPVSDRIVVLDHGRKVGDFARDAVSIDDLVSLITLQREPARDGP
jgi:simple sugar transport system ATP-binding protein